MRRAGRVVATVLQTLVREIKPGMKTRELDAICNEQLARLGGKASFLGYHGYPASVCVSINNEIVHGIPGDRVIKEGDLVSLDFGAVVDGYQGDAAVTVGVGNISAEAQRLMDATRDALMAGISKAKQGGHLGDISHAVQECAESRSYSVVREYTGHGIGREMHEEPQIPNFGTPGQGPLLRKGMTLAIEPMLNAGGWRTSVEPDKWTVVTADGSLSAHFEHTIAVTDDEPEILTVI